MQWPHSSLAAYVERMSMTHPDMPIIVCFAVLTVAQTSPLQLLAVFGPRLRRWDIDKQHFQTRRLQCCTPDASTNVASGRLIAAQRHVVQSQLPACCQGFFVSTERRINQVAPQERRVSACLNDPQVCHTWGRLSNLRSRAHLTTNGPRLNLCLTKHCVHP